MSTVGARRRWRGNGGRTGRAANTSRANAVTVNHEVVSADVIMRRAALAPALAAKRL